MTFTSKTNGHITYGTQEFIIDTAADVDNLPLDVAPGSTAFCVDDSSVYMLNTQGEWKEI